jgi:hypothetical protein
MAEGCLTSAVFAIAETARMSRGREGTDYEDRFRAY